jgi:alkanesulfonate monooxygenase SsuD/methylene tetrahydromethanopterin reductase-like flavin-dependent oxidoreductase (luciferase family)
VPLSDKLARMKLMWFHLMPYPALPENFNKEHRSVWVDIDPALFDRDIVAETYETYIDQLVYAEECGFDAICVNEHHNNGYGMMPSPNLIASILANRTSRAAITILGNSVALYHPPVRVAEEMAMVDVFSKGRVIAGFPVGTAMDTAYSYGINPTELRPRYYEGVELIRQAWNSTEPFAFNGEFNKYRYVNPLPRPYQTPHPPIWIPGGGSVETWDFCAENDFVYGALTYYGYKAVQTTVNGYWNRVEAHGKDPNPNRLGVIQFVGVADTDAEAYRLYKEPAEYFFNRSFHVYPGFTDAPGYVTEASVRAKYRSQVRDSAKAKIAAGELHWDEMVENGYVVIGSPDTVREQLESAAKDLNVGNLAVLCQFGNMHDELVRHNTKLFGEQVAPGLRGMFSEWDHPYWPSGATAAV